LLQGGSDLDTPSELLQFSIQPLKGNSMELKAEILSDARRWILILQAASKGLRPSLNDMGEVITSQALPQTTDESAGSDSTLQLSLTSDPDIASAQPADGNEDDKWVPVVDESGRTYYWNGRRRQSQWDPPADQAQPSQVQGSATFGDDDANTSPDKTRPGTMAAAAAAAAAEVANSENTSVDISGDDKWEVRLKEGGRE